jgi:hypothetical protein
LLVLSVKGHPNEKPNMRTPIKARTREYLDWNSPARLRAAKLISHALISVIRDRRHVGRYVIHEFVQFILRLVSAPAQSQPSPLQA